MQQPSLVAIEALVKRFTPGAMRDTMDDGFAVYDGATVVVTSPPELAGRELTFYVDAPAAPDAVWREIGALLCFGLRDGDLSPTRKLFSGAARDLKKC